MSTPRQKALAPSEALDGAAITSRSWTLPDSYRYCERLARSHYENFPVGSILVPAELRKHFYAIYAFARIADDFADEGYGEGYREEERLSWLREWNHRLGACYAGQADHPVFVALAATAGAFRLPIALFEDLLSAFSQDVTTRRYGTFAELLDYCRRSANPIGRLILSLFGYTDNAMMLQSDAICTALQLANHWQDIRIDLQKDRVYLPQEDMLKFGLTADNLPSEESRPPLRKLLELETAKAWDLFEQGKPLCSAAKGRLGLELRAVWLGGTRILRRIEKINYDVFASRPAINNRDKAGILLRALARRGF